MKLSVLLERPLTSREARKALARQTDALVGFEFEFAVPESSRLHAGNGTADTMELRRFSDIGDVFDYFDGAVRAKRRMESDYDEWVSDQKNEWIDDNWEMYEDDSIEDDDEREAAAREDAESRVGAKLDLSFGEFVDQEHGSWHNLITNYDLNPSYGWEDDRGDDRSTVYVQEVEGGEENTRTEVAARLADYLGVHVSSVDSPRYDHWKVVPDGSVTGGHDAEIVSPPMPWSEGIRAFKHIARFADDYGLETNGSTGLHINISVPGIKDIDIVKFVVFLGDDFALEVFGRTDNEFARSQSGRIITKLASAIKSGDSILGTSGFVGSPEFAVLKKAAYTGLSTHKYNSVNIGKLMESGYLEIRIAGGNYIDKAEDVMRLLNRLIIVMDLAMDPNMEKQLYMKKLTKLFTSALWHADPTTAATNRQYLYPLFSKSPGAYKLHTKLSHDLGTDSAINVAIQMVHHLSTAVRAARLPRLSFAQAAELLKLFKKHNLSIADIISAGGNHTADDMQALGLAK